MLKRGKEHAFSLGGLLLRFLHSCDKALCRVSPLWPWDRAGLDFPSVPHSHQGQRAVLWLNSTANVSVVAVQLGSNP